jgi:hypothetical protein
MKEELIKLITISTKTTGCDIMDGIDRVYKFKNQYLKYCFNNY